MKSPPTKQAMHYITADLGIVSRADEPGVFPLAVLDPTHPLPTVALPSVPPLHGATPMPLVEVPLPFVYVTGPAEGGREKKPKC